MPGDSFQPGSKATIWLVPPKVVKVARHGLEDFLHEVVRIGPTFDPSRDARSRPLAQPRKMVREKRLDEIPVLDHDGKPVGLVDVQDLIAMKVVVE